MSRLGFGGMVAAAYRPELFGGWKRAIESAGLDPKNVCRRRRKWTAQRIAQRIRELHEQGADLSHSAAKKSHQYLVTVACSADCFGSWRAAIEAAGLSYEDVSKHRSWSRESILSEIKRLHQAGEPLSYRQARREHGALVAAASTGRYFGSWAAALRAAGVNCEKNRSGSRQVRRRLALHGPDACA